MGNTVSALMTLVFFAVVFIAACVIAWPVLSYVFEPVWAVTVLIVGSAITGVGDFFHALGDPEFRFALFIMFGIFLFCLAATFGFVWICKQLDKANQAFDRWLKRQASRIMSKISRKMRNT